MLCGGCTSDRLRRRTISQGSTLTDIAISPGARQPGHVRLQSRTRSPGTCGVNGGLVQIADQGQGFWRNLGGPGLVGPEYRD